MSSVPQKVKPRQGWLTTKQVAERWGLATRTVQNWRQRGVGPKYTRVSLGNRFEIQYKLDTIKEFEKASRLVKGIRV